MTLDEVIEKYTNNAEYERQNGNLQGCLDFRQLAEWLKDYKRLLEQEPCRVKNELNVELNELKPCDDAISREMALKECHDIVVDGERYRVIQEETLLGLPPVTPSCDKCAMNGSGSKYCDNCGQKSGKWIPVSERLPEKAFGCFVTVEEDDMYGELHRVIYPDFVGYDETWNDADGEPIPFEVIAWMPLPEPYKGE